MISRRYRVGSSTLRLAVLAFLGLKCATLLVNLRSFPTLRSAENDTENVPEPDTEPGTVPPGPEGDAETIALLIPMRDEVHRLPVTLHGLLAAGADEIIFLDDESTDGSGDLVLEAISGLAPGVDPRPRVVRGTPRPVGWVGKTWPCAQLAELTSADILVFCDCDVRLMPGAARTITREMRRQQADVFSVFSRQLGGSWGERLILPLITDVVLCFLPFGLLRAPVPAAATAHGALLAFRRTALDTLGGFDSVRGELVEDVAIARRTRRLGLVLGLALGGDVAQIRMYDGYREIVAGLGRGLVPVAGGRRWPVVATLIWHLVVYTFPVLALGRSRWWGLAATLGLLERILVEAKTGGRDWPAAALVSLSPVASIPVCAQAMRRTQHWKSRSYP